MTETASERSESSLASLPYPWPSSSFVEELADRVVSWHNDDDAGPTETVRLEGLTVVAARDGSDLVLDITSPALQTDDRKKSTLPGIADDLPGFSLLGGNPEVTRIQLPIDEIR